MRNLNKDELTLIALHLDIKTFQSFFQTCKKFNRVGENSFWRNKLYKDYKNALIISSNFIVNYREVYKSKYLKKYKKYNIYLSEKCYGQFNISNMIIENEENCMHNGFMRRIWIEGIYPKGTKIWIYCCNIYTGYGKTNTREKAIRKLLKKAIKHDYISTDQIESLVKDFIYKNEVKVLDMKGQTINLIIKELILP